MIEAESLTQSKLQEPTDGAFKTLPQTIGVLCLSDSKISNKPWSISMKRSAFDDWMYVLQLVNF